MKRRENVIGIILTYNCGHLVEDLYRRVPRSYFTRIIVVDDGSTDETLQVVKKLGLVSYSHKHLGYGGNMKFGLKKALSMGADYIVEIHGDGQYDPSVIPEAIKKIKKGYYLLLGSRFIDIRQPLRDKMPIERYLSNIILSFIYRTILRVNLTEFHTGFHIYSRKFLSVVGFTDTSNGHLYSLEIIFQACFNKLTMCEVPIRCNYEADHTSISINKSIIYSVQSLLLSGRYILAKAGFKLGIFKYY